MDLRAYRQPSLGSRPQPHSPTAPGGWGGGRQLSLVTSLKSKETVAMFSKLKPDDQQAINTWEGPIPANTAAALKQSSMPGTWASSGNWKNVGN